MENNTMNNTTPTTTQLPLPAFISEIKELPAEITPTQARELISIARGNILNPAFDGYDPLARHRPLEEGEENDYSSRFYGPNAQQTGIPQIDDDDKVTLEVGHGGRDMALVIHVVKKDEFVGEYFPAVVPENAGIVVFKDPHGHGLIAVNTLHGDWGCIKSEPTREFSLVVYNTDGEENAGWVLASAYPGPQDETPDWSGLKEGDLVSSAEARRRHLRVRDIPIKDGKLVD
jgi:hypothetical protein